MGGEGEVGFAIDRGWRFISSTASAAAETGTGRDVGAR